ncbi:MAG: hypothetical protein IJJ45_08130 [Clostridia bacterium]|nr:hypothetical protein [Clostridia bacterium]
MMNHSTDAIRIPRTDRFFERFNARMKFLLGDDVRVGREYDGWETIDGARFDGPCRTIHYDGRLLFVLESDDRSVAVLCGDMADDHGRLIADQRHGHYSIPELRDSVDRYMARNVIPAYTTEVGYRALWRKMAPRSLIAEYVRVYEMTLGL